ncbi:MAG: hypothetical protein FJZ92_14135, partial [Chloroflexi bacterium]|nr:hypothetical protein [Chloroflexota bacterium]
MTSTLEGRPARPDAEHTALIGRARELEALCAQFDRAARGAGGVALIHGEAGIGKTRLAVEFDRVAHGHGATCWFAHAETASGPPYAFWLELLKGAVEGSGDPSRWLELRSYLDELGRQARWLSQPGAAFAALGKHGLGVIDAMGEPALQLIAAACRDAPLVVTIDDAQSLAGTDVELLGRLAARTTRLPALIVLACRDDAPGTAPALESLLARLTQARLLRRYPLGGFGASEVAAYLRERMGTAPSAALAEAVLRRTEGNPFFLAEVATLLMHDPRAAEPVVAVSLLPDSVRDVLQVRLAQLTRPCRELLAAAAVIGEEFDHGVLAGAVGAGAVGDVGAALEEALARRVIVVGSSGGAYRFAHSLTRDTILEQLSPLRRAELHGRAAGALAA